jgi:hypothetical protein
MKKYWSLLGIAVISLSPFVTRFATGQSIFPAAEKKIKQDLVFFGPAKDGMQRAGFNPSGSITLFETAEETGTDKLRVDVEGLPPDTDFTVFLHELSDIPFGSSEYIAELHTDKKGRAGVTVKTLIEEAFALKTTGNPPTTRVVDADLNFVAIWFADPADSARFVNFPVVAFDGDRSSGPVVLGTMEPLP